MKTTTCPCSKNIHHRVWNALVFNTYVFWDKKNIMAYCIYFILNGWIVALLINALEA